MIHTTGFRFAVLAAILLAAVPFCFAQTNYDPLTFAYGAAGGPPALVVDKGNSATGSQTITLAYGVVSTKDGTPFAPITTNTPILVGSGSSQDSVTPSAVSCSTPAIYQSCTVTATFTYTHGRGDLVASGSYGLQEAVNYVAAFGGGVVNVGASWTKAGGTAAMLNAATGYGTVSISDRRGGTAPPYWTLQPTTLTSLAAPATLDATSVTWTGTTGTWTNVAQYLCVTYVDVLGGEGPCSATYNVTPAANTILNIKSPVASTGAVGWRAYAGASYNGAYLLPITSAKCTLTTAESVIPACAIGSNGQWSAIFLTTTTLRPNAQSPAVGLNLPFPQGHTTFGMRPSGMPAQPFQTHYGPFPAFGATSTADIIGSVNLPTGFLNYIGRTVRISGKVALTSLNTAVPTIKVSLGWVGGTTAGAPVDVCVLTGAALTAAAYNGQISCTMTTNATGTTGTIMPNGWWYQALAASGTAGGIVADTGVAAIASLDLTKQNTVFISYASGTANTSAVQLVDLHVEVLQ